jgi:peptidoglycan/xylan/chitin deacetylase (PgdA/CDA1 family)
MKKILYIFVALFLTACGGKGSVATVPPISPSQTLAPGETPFVTFTPAVTATISPVLITSGDWTQPRVALTFDVCQDPKYPADYDSALVDVLREYDIPATFFLGGDWMRTHIEETRMLASVPKFELANHSWSHPDFTKLSEEEIAQEIKTTEELLFQLTGKHSRFFRPPFGFTNDLTLQTVSRLGLHTVTWDSVSGDPDPNFDAATILAEVQRIARNGSIVIMHANGRGWHTAEALPSIIEYLQAQGFTLVTVSDLLEIK